MLHDEWGVHAEQIAQRRTATGGPMYVISSNIMRWFTSSDITFNGSGVDLQESRPNRVDDPTG
jgi:hypothetical protein